MKRIRSVHQGVRFAKKLGIDVEMLPVEDDQACPHWTGERLLFRRFYNIPGAVSYRLHLWLFCHELGHILDARKRGTIGLPDYGFASTEAELKLARFKPTPAWQEEAEAFANEYARRMAGYDRPSA